MLSTKKLFDGDGDDDDVERFCDGLEKAVDRDFFTDCNRYWDNNNATKKR